METKIDVIYCRFSSELQRTESVQDQERRCRDSLDRLGIPHGHFRVITDEAISGTQEERDGFNQIKELIAGGRLGLLVVTEQSRLTRGDNAKSLIKDIVYHGGRFISITEGIDTNKKGWQMLVGFTELHHSRSNEDTAERVRGGQEGRVLDDDDGSAGDYCYGYRSEYKDPTAALKYHSRGPKPRKRVVIDKAAAAVVLRIFEFFVMGKSISFIVRWWEKHKDEFPPITKSHIHHQHVRRILQREKYIGIWTFGLTTTLTDGAGNKKQVPALAHQKVTRVSRPRLRIVSQELWDKAQARIAELKEIYGLKPNGKKRGPAEHYRILYATTLLNGIVRCGKCGRRMVIMHGGPKRLGCPLHRVGMCPMTARVPYDRAQKEILKLLQPIFLNSPAWIQEGLNHARKAIEEMVAGVPDESKRIQAELSRLEKEIGNLLDALAGGIKGDSIRKRLASLEDAKARLSERADDAAQAQAAKLRMPTDRWLADELRSIAANLDANLAVVAQTLRKMLVKIVAEEVKPPGKKRGYVRLHLRINGWTTIKPLLAKKLPDELLQQLRPPAADTSVEEEFVIDLGAPTRLDELAPQIAKMRDAGAKWKDILFHFRDHKLTLGNAWTAYSRWKRHEGRPKAA